MTLVAERVDVRNPEAIDQELKRIGVAKEVFNHVKWKPPSEVIIPLSDLRIPSLAGIELEDCVFEITRRHYQLRKLIFVEFSYQPLNNISNRYRASATIHSTDREENKRSLKLDVSKDFIRLVRQVKPRHLLPKAKEDLIKEALEDEQ